MALTIDLNEDEGRLLRLAVFYMLGHPRWQSDRATQGRRAELVDVYDQLQNAGSGTLALRIEPPTVGLLDSALGRVMPELKTFGMLSSASAGKRDASMVEGFDEELALLFPNTAGDPGNIEELLPGLMALRRDFTRATRGLAELEAGAQKKREESIRRPWWQLWRR